MKNININLLFVLLFLLTACSDWLDVDLVNEEEERKLFQTEQGFHEALAGVYSKMSKSEMYGATLTFGGVDVLGQVYDFSNMLTGYKSLSRYNYEEQEAKDWIESVWANGYYTIAMVNNILNYEQSQGDCMPEQVRQQVKGEALALRAWLHFDLWRLFAPSYSQDKMAECLPYSRVFGIEVQPLCSSEQFLNYCLVDCETALRCLEKDPVLSVTPYQIEGSTKNEADQYVARINYYAVKGLMARIYLTRNSAGDKVKARTLAEEVIASKKFALLDYTKSFPENADQWDILFSDEHIFSLRNAKIKSYSEGLHYVVSGITNQGNLQMTDGLKSEVYNGSDNDIRFRRWINNVSVRKYYMSEANNEFFTPKVPLMRLSEMYLIAAEGWLEEDAGVAQSLVEELRKSRFMGEGEEYKLTAFDAEVLLAEMRREYLCEGQMFFIYKRLHHDILRQTSPGNVKASNEVFVLPMPDAEKENGNRN